MKNDVSYASGYALNDANAPPVIEPAPDALCA